MPAAPPPRYTVAEPAVACDPALTRTWKKLNPRFDRGLALYDNAQSERFPESSWVPLRPSQTGYRRDLDDLLDKIVALLARDPADDIRARIRRLQAEAADAQATLARHHERRLMAPAEDSLSFVEGFLVSTRESCDDAIRDEIEAIDSVTRQIERLKEQFRARLEAIGVVAEPDTVDLLLLPPQDALVATAAVVAQVIALTRTLHHLVDAAREAPAETRRYYGIYLLMVMAVDRAQRHYLDELDGYQDRLNARRNSAEAAIVDARRAIAAGGPRDILTANIDANRRSIDACRRLADVFQTQRQSVAAENRRVRVMEAAARNTYRTMQISLDVADIIGQCQAAFAAVRALELPPLRAFEGLQLNQDLQSLAAALTRKEK